jgi:hypothetical protein
MFVWKIATQFIKFLCTTRTLYCSGPQCNKPHSRRTSAFWHGCFKPMLTNLAWIWLRRAHDQHYIDLIISENAEYGHVLLLQFLCRISKVIKHKVKQFACCNNNYTDISGVKTWRKWLRSSVYRCTEKWHTDHILIDRWWQSGIFDVGSFRGADCDAEQYLVGAQGL